ncbi:hypothetical protein BGZ82_009922 [Podila clonocystis]|nr:hypothetical protein BGZ82_009922 [Podila clonocystis]
MPSSSKTPKMAQVLLLAVSSWIGIVSANVNFAAIPATLMLKPGDSYDVIWTVSTPTNATMVNMNPFTLQLRAVTNQRYTLQANVTQSSGTARIQIPLEATGGGHKFYADYQGNPLGPNTAMSGLFNIAGPPGSTTSTNSGAQPTESGAPAADTGMSGGALAGIIGGVVVLFLGVALIFYFRHRRRIAERVADSRSMSESKEGFGAYSKNQDKESLTRSAGSGGGPAGSIGSSSAAGAAAGGPRSRPDERSSNQQQQGMNANPMAGGAAGGPRPRPEERSANQQQGMNAAMSNNRNDGSGGNSPTTRNPFEGAPSPRHEQYQPPAMAPQPPRPYQQQSPFANPPMHQQQPPRNQSPYQQHLGNRDSFESELESAYDPTHRANPMLNRNDSNPDGARSSPLSHSASGSRYPHNTTPQPTQQNPFASQDREMMAVAAAVAAAASPVQGHRQLDPRSQSPVSRSATPRAIEMQPLDIQQHHLEQQQRMAQRQQQQQTQAQTSPKSQTPVQPLPAAQQSINPTQFDDKAEIEEDSGPAYNGYRDTIFGAYAQNQDDDDEEDEAPVPIVPNHLASAQNNKPNDTPAPTGGAEIQRKKSVKFTGVPASGPIVLPNHEAAKEHQIQKSKQHQHQQQTRPVSDQVYSDEDGDYDDEDETEIQMRMIEQELAAASPAPSAGSRPYVNTGSSNAGGSSPYVSALSPVRSPDQSHGNVNDESLFGNDFYEDVIAAVDKNKGAPESPTSPIGLAYNKPPMPPPPAAVPAPPRSAPPSQQQQFVQQQHIPVPQPQHMAKEVFGAPSPRIAPASLPSQSNSSRPPRANTRPSPPPGASRQQHHGDDEEAAFYASSLM